MFSSVSASEASELVNLILMLLLVPVTIYVLRDRSLPGRTWLTVAFLTVAAVRAYSRRRALSPGQSRLPDKQFATAFAGVAFAVGLWQLALALRRRELL